MLVRQKHTNAINMAALYSSLNRKQKAQSVCTRCLHSFYLFNSNKQREKKQELKKEWQKETDKWQTNKANTLFKFVIKIPAYI